MHIVCEGKATARTASAVLHNLHVGHLLWRFRMISVGVKPLVCQSFSKNMGLYGERVGCCSVVCDSAEEAVRRRVQRHLVDVCSLYIRVLWLHAH